MKKEKITWEVSPQQLDCMLCRHHQATWKVVFEKPLKINLVICSVCAKLTQQEIIDKLLRRYEK